MHAPPQQAHNAKFRVCPDMGKQLSAAERLVVAFPHPVSIPFQFSPRNTHVICIGKIKTRSNVKRFSEGMCCLIECTALGNMNAAYVTHTFF